MIKIITTVLILFSSVASIYYSVVSVMKPENALVYNKANMSHFSIQLLSLLLGIGGMLLLFPQTFKLGGAFLIIHSLTTIVCYIITNDWKGGVLEFLFLQIPIFIIWTGYPFRNFFIQ